MSEPIKVIVKRGDTVEEADTQTARNLPSGSNWLWWPLLFLAVAFFILAIAALLFKDPLINGRLLKATTPSEPSYQAVFLANGQVYFGKLSDPNRPYATLKDIYYLQVVQQQLQGQQSTQQTGQTPQVSLVRLGNELHGPEDEMKISNTQILFYEDLKPDSQVVKAINDYKANPHGSSIQTQQSPATPSNQ